MSDSQSHTTTPDKGMMPPPGPGRGLLGYATDAECIAACLKRIGHLELVMRECCDAIHDNDEFGAMCMLEAALMDQTP